MMNISKSVPKRRNSVWIDRKRRAERYSTGVPKKTMMIWIW